MSAHTPGPWKVTKLDNRYAAFEIQPTSTRERNRYLGLANSAPKDEVDAVQRLIAAAPELLAALRLLFDCLDLQRDELCEAAIAHVPELEAARTAIAKATGSAT